MRRRWSDIGTTAVRDRKKINNKGRHRWSEVPEWILGELGICLLSYLWYDSRYWFPILQILLIPYGYYLKSRRMKIRRRQYERGFYEFLQSMLPSLQAGYSLENASIAAYRELREMNGERHAFVEQLALVVRGIEVHVPVEDLFHEMASATESEDIRQFAVILEILKNMGGNSVEVLKNSMIRIQKKMETGEEIRTLLSGKIYEKNLMLLMPFFLMVYLRISNGSYLDLLYHTIPGQMVMTAALAGVIACFYWSEHIMGVTRSLSG